MKERTKENFFILVRIALIFGLAAYGTMNLFLQAGVSVGMLLLVAFFISVLIVREVFPKPYRKWFLLLSVILYALILYLEPEHFLMGRSWFSRSSPTVSWPHNGISSLLLFA